MSKNLAIELEKYLPPPVLALIKIAGQEAGELDQELYIVGGVVRDLFLGRTNFDFDLVVQGDAISFARRLAIDSRAKLIFHTRFGTAKLKYPSFSLDIAAARSETYNRPGSLPIVKPGSLKDDLIRRDFSINAMALHLNPQRFGELIDLHHGKDDLDHGLIRIMHPKSFIDDATRILRAIRYEQRLGFRLEAETEKLLRRDVKMLDTISGDRLRHELELILKENEPERILWRAQGLGVLRQLHPSLTSGDWLSKAYVKARQFGGRTLLATLYLCLLIYNLNKKENEEFIVRLNFPGKLAEVMRQTLQLKTQLHNLAKPEIKPSNIYELVNGYSSTAIHANILASESSIVYQHLNSYLNKLRYVKPLLNGRDLKKMGIPDGPKIGNILNAIHKARLNGDIKTRHDEVRLANNWRQK